jgi:hypothetical protein
VLAVLSKEAPSAPILERPWAGLEVRRWTALARTRLTLFGAVDGTAVSALRRAMAEAASEGHEISLDLGNITVVKRSALNGLLELAVRTARP